MKIVGLAVLLAGILFTVFTFFTTPETPTHTAGWAPWVGLLVIVTGAVAIFKTRKA